MSQGSWVVALSFVTCLSLTGASTVKAMTDRPECAVGTRDATVSNANKAAEPLLVLFERNPWLMAVGSDFPSVVIYEDGQVIFIDARATTATAKTGHVDPASALRLRDKFVEAGFLRLPSRTTCSRISDQTTVEILLRNDASWTMASAYGIGKDGKCGVAPDKAFVDAYIELQKIKPDDAGLFAPDEIEVAIWDFDHSRDDPLPWPRGVPAPPADVVPEYYEPYSPKPYKFDLASKFRPAVDELLRQVNATNPPKAVLLNGHKWTVSQRWLWPGSADVEASVRCARASEKE